MNEVLLLAAAFFAAHIAWRAGYSLRATEEWEQPMFVSRLGVAGSIYVATLVPIAFAATVAALAWGFIRLPWYAPIPLFFAAGLGFAFVHTALSKAAPLHYVGYFPACGALLGGLLIATTQVLLWVR